LDPFEVLDVLLLAQDEMGVLTAESLSAFHTRMNSENEEEQRQVIASIDENGDGVLVSNELGEKGSEIVSELDLNGSGVLEFSEALNINSEDQLLLSREEMKSRVVEYFLELDENRNGLIDVIHELNDSQQDRARELDGNRDGQVSRDEALAFIQADNIPVKFEVEGEVAFMTGVITSRLPAKILRLLFEYPGVEVIEMKIVPGSIDDVVRADPFDF